MVFIDVEELIGKSFDVRQDDNTTSKITVVDAIRNHEENTKQNSVHTKFKVKHNKDKYEEILTYNELMDHLHKLEDGPIMWELRKIVSHQGPLDKNHPNYMGSPYNVGVKWENGEILKERLSIIVDDAPVECAIYALQQHLPANQGWNRYKDILNSKEKYFMKLIKQKLDIINVSLDFSMESKFLGIIMKL